MVLMQLLGSHLYFVFWFLSLYELPVASQYRLAVTSFFYRFKPWQMSPTYPAMPFLPFLTLPQKLIAFADF